MALDPTARESNYRDSLKKFFVDNIYTTEGVELSFDKGITNPKAQGTEVQKWVSVDFGELIMDTLSTGFIRVYCCTKKDNEGFKLAQLRDTVYTYLTDADQPDGTRRITHYRSRAVGSWTAIGSIAVYINNESSQMTASDETKFKYFEVMLKFGSKV